MKSFFSLFCFLKIEITKLYVKMNSCCSECTQICELKTISFTIASKCLPRAETDTNKGNETYIYSFESSQFSAVNIHGINTWHLYDAWQIMSPNMQFNKHFCHWMQFPKITCNNSTMFILFLCFFLLPKLPIISCFIKNACIFISTFCLPLWLFTLEWSVSCRDRRLNELHGDTSFQEQKLEKENTRVCILIWPLVRADLGSAKR